MLDRVRASLQARLEGRDDGGDREVMRLVDLIVQQAVEELRDPVLPPEQFGQVEVSPRQLEVIQLVAAGKSTTEIALVLGINKKTVDWHKAEIKTNLDLHTTADIVRYAIAKNLTHRYEGG